MGIVCCLKEKLLTKFPNQLCKNRKNNNKNKKKANFLYFCQFKTYKNNRMKSYIGNLNGLHIKYIIINFIVSLAGFILALIIGDVIKNPKVNMYLSVIMMMIVLVFFLIGKKKYQNELLKIKDYPLGKRLNSHQQINKKRLNTFTFMNAFAVLFLILSNNYLYLFFSLLFLALIFLNRTSRFKLKIELNLNDKELDSLSKPIDK